MPDTIERTHRGRLVNFEPIFRQWVKANLEIAHAWRRAGDVPWDYNERASLSIFAGAVWRAGGFVFEEFSDKKRRIKRATGALGGSYFGRTDIYFNWHRWDFVAEAKITWSGISDNKDPLARINKWLDLACRDVRQVERDRQRKLGILFATPYFRRDHLNEVDTRIGKWIELLDEADATAYACVFPDCTRSVKGRDEYYYPGTAVIIREL